jgi:hypothetical protein
MRTLALLIILFAAYWFALRPVLRQRAELMAFYAHADLVEAGIIGRLRLMLKGWKTILWGRFLMFAGALLPLLQGLDFIDLTELLPPIRLGSFTLAPSIYVPALLLPALGWINNTLRYATDGAVGENTFVTKHETGDAPADPAAAAAPVAPASPA